MAIPSMDTKVAIEKAMKSHVDHNINLMDNWHRLVVVEHENMSVEAIDALASSNHRASAASAVLTELAYSHTADRIENALSDYVQHELRSNGPKEYLAVYLEAQQVLTGADARQTA